MQLPYATRAIFTRVSRKLGRPLNLLSSFVKNVMTQSSGSSGLQRLEAELASVASIREEHRRLQVSSAVGARRSQRQIETLERQVVDLRSQLTALTGHPDLGSAPPPALARRLQAQDRERTPRHSFGVRRTLGTAAWLGFVRNVASISNDLSLFGTSVIKRPPNCVGHVNG
ncbi:hypothetical protein F441_22371 [Phytophthora nicotianae CJ01A1]|uniref:Uncharacterized protein n=1 Tax=Phytophthora nicotianae CJ01A1 TaxID=1317063 RepID=W2VS88_PHYNI|nr:hypothetical protein F441_22371 [Phytophthora nicotianae CJ01A1]